MANLQKDPSPPADLISDGKVTTKQHNIIIDRLGGETSLTGNRVLVTEADGDIIVSSVTDTTLSYLDATSSIQTQLNNKQPLDSDLTTIAGLVPGANDILQYVASAWANRTPAQVKTSLSLVKADVGLGNVDNTSDADKPISTATQTALDGKSATGHTHTLANVTDVTMTVSNLNILDDGNNTTLHFHDSDRARANHIGTQLKATISDFAHTHPKTEIDDTGTWETSEIPNLDAAKITTGQFVMARLASGTPDGSKFIRDDGVLASPGASSTNIKQTEIDFGVTPVSNSIFTITDADVSATSQLLAQMAYEAPTGKDLDETEMDNLSIRCKPSTGSFDLYIESIDGSYLADKFKVNYLIG